MLKYALVTLTALVVASGCATDPAPKKPNAAESASIEAKMAAAQSGSADVAEVKFAPATSNLKKIELDKIKNAYQAAMKKSKVSHVTLAAWSDSESPKGEKDLIEAEVELSKARGEMLKQQVKALDANLRVKVINMAEQPDAIKKFLKTESVRIRETLASAGEANPKASRAILIFVPEEK